MADTEKLGITKIEASQSQKEVTANAAFDKFDKAIAGYEDIDIAGGAGNQTLSADEQLNSAIVLSGTITGARNVIVSTEKKWHFFNDCDGEYTVTVKTADGTGVEIPAGEWREVLNDGTNVVEIGGGGGGGGGTWGGITGTLADQTDLQAALNEKPDPEDIPTDLVDLDDFPAAYTGHGGKLLRVTTGEDGVEFVDPSVQAAIMSQTVGDGSEDTFAIPHGFGSLDVIVIVREATDSGADGYIRIDTGYEVRYYDSDTVQVIFDSPPSAGQYIVTCALPWIQADVPVASPGSSTYATPGEYEFVVPPGVDEIVAKVWGAAGGGTRNNVGVQKDGGAGGFAQATLSVTAGEVLTVHVGAGGAGYFYLANETAAAPGGGLCAILRGSTPLIVAGSGGGAGICNSTDAADSGNGGAGGGSSGVAGGGPGAFGGGGGTQSAGGAGGTSSAGTNGGAGGFLTGGTSGYANSETYDGYGGGGGAGYYGGGGGGGDSDSGSTNADAGGGGGGSGYVSGTSTTLTAGSGTTPAGTGDADYVTGVGVGYNGDSTPGGNGYVKISWS